MAKERRIYMVRHGETVYNILGKVQGWSDSPLTDTGKQQARKAGMRLSQIPFTFVYTSGLKRQKDTARFVVEENICADTIIWEMDDRLKELYYGSFEEHTEDEMLRGISRVTQMPFRTFRELLEEMSLYKLADLVAKADPEAKAEKAKTALSRLTEVLRDIGKKMEEKEAEYTLVVTSGGIMGLLLEHMNQGGGCLPIVQNGDIMVLATDGYGFQMDGYYNGEEIGKF